MEAVRKSVRFSGRLSRGHGLILGLAAAIVSAAPAMGQTGPTITSQPSGQSVIAGAPVSFSIVATGSDPLAYQWKKDGSDVSGATSATLNIASALPADNGAVFTCLVSDAFGSVLSDGATLTVTNGAPNGVVSQPSGDITIMVGDSLYFEGLASDPEGTAHQPFTYLWTFGAGSGIADSTVRVPGLRTFNNAGAFTVTFQVTDAFGAADPTPATVTITVIDPSTINMISQAGWTVHFVDSESFGEEAEKAFDGNPNTIWHTEASPNRPPPPHDLQINLGTTATISGFQYLPRQDGVLNGNIGQYRFYKSSDGINWGSPIAEGTLPTSSSVHIVNFPATSAAYVRLLVLEEVNRQAYTSIAELNLISPEAIPNSAPNGVIDSPAGSVQIVAGGTVDFRGSATDPDGDTPLLHRWSFPVGSEVVDSTREDPGLVRFNVPGTYVVTYTVADPHGWVDPTPATKTVTVLAATDVVSNAAWSVHFVDSEELVAENGAAANAFDGDSNTIWHTEYLQGGPDLLPHELQIDLGQGYDIGGFQYLPRQGDPNGRIGDFRFYVSADGVNWGSPLVDDTFGSTPVQETFNFASRQGRYVRLRALSEQSGQEFTSVAELGVLEAPVITPSLRILTPSSNLLQTSSDLYVLVDANLGAGQGVRISLDGGSAGAGQEVDLYNPPFETTFSGISADPHSVTAQVIDSGGAPVSGPGTVDQVTNVGVGDYYVAVGDSITWGELDDITSDDSSADGTNQTRGYTPILADQLSVASGRRTMVLNEGVPGERTAEGAADIANILQKHPNARRVLVMLGTNDTGSVTIPSGLGKNPGDAGYDGSYKDYLQQIVDEINAAGKTAILGYPPAALPVNGTRDLKVQELLNVIDEIIANPANNIPFAAVDNYSQFAANSGTWYGDSLHPNGLGYQHMADIWFAAISSFKESATVTFSNLTQTYDGTSKSPTAITSPEGLTVDLTFDGSSTPPVNAGSYALVGTINDFSYQGSASDTFVIQQAPATVTLSNLSQVYDGTARNVTVTTTPAGLSVDVTYDGGAAVPVNAGSYAVVATVNDPNYTGSASDTLVVAKATATVTLSNLSQTYDGTAKSATVTTVPAGLSVDVTYDGSATEPTDAGSYAVVAAVTDPNYSGSASDTLVVAKATATVTLSNLSQTYDGTPKSATVTTVPAGLSVDVTYDGSATEPTDAGTYAVVATVNDPNYTGSASDSLVINPATATVTLSDLAQTYDGTGKSATVTTNPTGLAVSVTYDGGATLPVNPGSYAVQATVTDPNYTGSASGTLTIGKATATVTLSGLSQTYDGSAKQVGVTTVPAGLAVDVTYDGSANAPTAAGSYAIVATVNDANYEGNATGTLVISKAPASVTLSNLAHTYDGTGKSATVDTVPAALPVSVTYDGVTAPPSNAGSYAVEATVTDPNFAGSASGTLSIAKASAQISLSGLLQAFDGLPKPVTASTNPTGLATAVTYDGSSSAPSAAGVYAVAATVTDSNFEGSASGTLTIFVAPSISAQPQGGVFLVGEAVTLSVQAAGTPAVTYQWRRDGTDIPGANQASLSIPGIQATDAGAYSVVVANVGGSVTSAPATVSVEPLHTGVWFGGFGESAGDWALSIDDDAAGRFYAFVENGGVALIVDVAIDGQGHFTGVGSPVAASGSGAPGQVTVSGDVSGRNVTGSVAELGLTFSGSRDLASTTPAAPVGSSAAPEINATTGESHIVVGPSGVAFALVATDTVIDGGNGTVDGSGELSTTLIKGTSAVFNFDAGSGSVSGQVVAAGGSTSLIFQGLHASVEPVNRILNLSTRGVVRGGDEAMIVGFVVQGTGTREVLIRGVGPTLLGAPFNVPGALTDAVLEVRRQSDQSLVAINDNWGDAANADAIRDATARIGAFALQEGSGDAALLLDLPAGAYTAIISGGSGATGVAIAEVYSVDDTPQEPVRLVNISTRGFVGTADEVLIPGFVTAGNYPRTLLIRAVGPTLAGVVPGVLDDPVLKILPAGGGEPLLVVDDWEAGGKGAEIAAAAAAVGAFNLDSGSKDAAALFTVPPGQGYTIQVTGKSGATGVVLAEVYEVP